MRVLVYNPKPSTYDNVDKEECCTTWRPEPWLPSQMILSASYLQAKGWEADFLDAQVDGRPVDFGDYDAVVVWSSLLFSLFSDLTYLKKAKEAGARTVLVLNDPPAELEKETLDVFGFVDAAVRLYEREATLERLLGAWKIGGKIPPGVVYRDNGKVMDNGQVPALPDATHLGSSAKLLETLRLDRYKAAYITTGRGCVHGCAFCSFRNSGSRKRKVEDISSELEVVAEKIPPPLYLLDLNMLSDRKWARSLSDALAGKGYRWFTDATAVLATRENVGLLSRAGCFKLTMGAESADPEILKKIHKPTSLDGIHKAADNCRDAGVIPHFTFMIGFPWEGWATYDRYIRLIKSLKPCEYSIQFLLPLRGSPIYDTMKQMGFFEELHVWDYFGRGIDAPMFPTKHLTRAQLVDAKKRIDMMVSPAGHVLRRVDEFWRLGRGAKR